MLPDDIRIDALIWDSWNRAHIARHNVTRKDVEEVCTGRFVTLTGYAGRIMVVGQNRVGRALTAVLEPDTEGMYYVVTARSSSRRERRVYREVIG